MDTIATQGTIVGSQSCFPVCKDAPETTDHLFSECHKVEHRLEKLKRDTKITLVGFWRMLFFERHCLVRHFPAKEVPDFFLLILGKISHLDEEERYLIQRQVGYGTHYPDLRSGEDEP